MNHVYIQFEMSKDIGENVPESIWKQLAKKIIIWISYRIFPKANPDYDKKIDEVSIWLLECGSEGGVPTREIGLNADEKPIVKMPYNRNYGYWTDNNMTLPDFNQQFQAHEINQAVFEQKWESLM